MTARRGWKRWVVFACVVIEAGWMAFDGGHALATGDYVTPESGAHAGQLGPWATVVSAVGLDPRGTPMKLIFLLYGLAWLGLTVFYLLRRGRGRRAMMVAALGSLWYLPFGTALGLVQIALFLTDRPRPSS